MKIKALTFENQVFYIGIDKHLKKLDSNNKNFR